MSLHFWKVVAALICLGTTEALAERTIEKIGEWEFGTSTETENNNRVIYYSSSLRSATNPRAKLVFRCNALTGFARVYVVGMHIPKTNNDFVVTFAMDNNLQKQIYAHSENGLIQFGTTSGLRPPQEKSSIFVAVGMAQKLILTVGTVSASFNTSRGLDAMEKLISSCDNFSFS